MDRPVIVFDDEDLEIPAGILDLPAFRAWLHSPSFPERGRIDWLRGRMEVDMSPENLRTHGSPKTAIAGALWNRIYETRRGHVYIDRGRITSPVAGLSAEPDVLVVLAGSLESGRVKFVALPSDPEGSIELEGAADLVVECVSKSSVRKDTIRLKEIYHQAGVREYWIVDARRDPASFEVLVHRPQGYEASPPDADGFRASPVLGADVRFVRDGESGGLVFFRLDVRLA